MDLGNKLQKVKLEEAGDACTHFRGLMNLQEELASMGKTLDNAEFMSILLNTLPASYEAIISIINATADCTGNPVTLEQVIELVIVTDAPFSRLFLKSLSLDMIT